MRSFLTIVTPLVTALALACSHEPATSTDQGSTGTPEGGTSTTTAPEATAAPDATTGGEPGTSLVTDASATGTSHAATTDEATTGALTGATTGAACAVEATDACSTCMADTCCETVAACEADPDCSACVSGADVDVCESNAGTHARVDAYLACKGGPCQAECIGDPVGSCEDALAELQQDDCTTCLGSNCCDEVAACHGNEVCWTGCFTVHDDDICHSDPNGHALYHALSACASQSCVDACF